MTLKIPVCMLILLAEVKVLLSQSAQYPQYVQYFRRDIPPLLERFYVRMSLYMKIAIKRRAESLYMASLSVHIINKGPLICSSYKSLFLSWHIFAITLFTHTWLQTYYYHYISLNK
jgi:hypothetical protein